jgi:NAD(P)-dependent dehydrogenase (short-subunit alcohol dehydrogenase family)
MLPLLRSGGGRIVFTSSDNGRWAPPYMGPYAASKFALEAIADTFRLELRRSKIPVSIIEPGSIRTSIWDKGIDRIAAGDMKLGPDSSEHYGDVTTLMRNAMQEGKANGIPPERVADAIHHALTARRPKTRYRIGRDARMMIMLKSVLPDRAFDSAVSRIIGRFGKG